jgi:hypothetical protein
MNHYSYYCSSQVTLVLAFSKSWKKGCDQWKKESEALKEIANTTAEEEQKLMRNENEEGHKQEKKGRNNGVAITPSLAYGSLANKSLQTNPPATGGLLLKDVDKNISINNPDQNLKLRFADLKTAKALLKQNKKPIMLISGCWVVLLFVAMVGNAASFRKCSSAYWTQQALVSALCVGFTVLGVRVLRLGLSAERATLSKEEREMAEAAAMADAAAAGKAGRNTAIVKPAAGNHDAVVKPGNRNAAGTGKGGSGGRDVGNAAQTVGRAGLTLSEAETMAETSDEIPERIADDIPERNTDDENTPLKCSKRNFKMSEMVQHSKFNLLICIKYTLILK